MKNPNSRSQAAKLHRAELKTDPIRTAQFQEKVRVNMKRIWKERRSSGEHCAIGEKIRQTLTNQYAQMTPTERKVKCSNLLSIHERRSLYQKTFGEYFKNTPTEQLETMYTRRFRTFTQTIGERGLRMSKGRMSYKGVFTPKFPEKYAGNAKNIVYRSHWELKFMHQLDQNINVLAWASEELVIKYFDPVKNKARRYFPDFLVKAKTRTGDVVTTIIEIKPDYQTNLRAAPKRSTRQYLQEVADVATNQAKWSAATAFAKEQGWNFVVITEKNFSF
jgi:TnsA endonuclease N terminal